MHRCQIAAGHTLDNVGEQEGEQENGINSPAALDQIGAKSARVSPSVAMGVADDESRKQEKEQHPLLTEAKWEPERGML